MMASPVEQRFGALHRRAVRDITRIACLMAAIQSLAVPVSMATEGSDSVESEIQFVESWIEALRESGSKHEFEAGRGVEIFRIEDGTRVSYFYGRTAYEKYLEDPSRKKEQLSLLVSMVERTASSSAKAPTVSKLVPLLRSRSWLAHAGVEDIPSKVLPGGPAVVLAEDQGDRIRHLQSQEVAKLVRPFDELISMAVENLRTIAPVRQEDLGSVLMLLSGGDYEASLALDRKLIADISERLGDDVIFAIPTTDTFLIGRKDEAAVEALARAIGGQVLDEEEPLSSMIYEYRNDELTALAEVGVEDGQITVSAP